MRPHEICQRYKLQPEFFVQGGSRFDLIQGEMGDCWVIAAASSVSNSQSLLERLVPPGQSFRKDWYSGLFRFRFWRYGSWVEVTVDDRLPTTNGKLMMVQSNHPNEFWGALLEKAYAKLHGSYEALKGGSNADALTDFTGGLVQSYSMISPPRDLTKLLAKAIQRNSVMSASIYGDYVNNPVSRNGLVSGHAYSVTAFTKVQQEYLLRIRNPWGTEVEWRGRWSDSSPEWKKLSAAEKQQLGLVVDHDGEFWIEMTDFIDNFDSIEICNLTADSLREPQKSWAISTVHSKWRRNKTAGGRPELSTFWQNPQFQLTVSDHDEDDDKMASIVVEILQKNRRRLNVPYLAIGFAIYRISPGTKVPLDKAYLSHTDPDGAVDQYINTRTVNKRFTLEPGSFVIIPTAWNANEEGEFMLRVFSEAPNTSKEIS